MNDESNGGLFFPTRPSLGRNVLWIVSVALIYLCVARFSLLFVFEPEGIAAIWPLSGIFLSASLLTRRELRPWLVGVLFMTDFIAEMLAGTPWVVSLIYALAVTAEAVLSIWLLLRFVGEPITFRRVRELVGWLLLSVILSNALASLAAAAASQLLPGTAFWNSWLEWAASDGIGNLLVTPLVLSWAAWGRTISRGLSKKRVLETVALFILLELLVYLTFGFLSKNGLFLLLLSYLIFFFLLWAALRFGVRGVASASIILAAIAIYFAATGRVNILNEYSTLDVVINVQLFLAVMAAPALFLATVMTERKQADAAVRASEDKFKHIFEDSNIGKSITQVSGEISVNQAFCEMLGYSPEELQRKKWQEITHPDDIEVTQREIDPLLSGEKDAVRFNKRYLKKDGSVIWVDLSSSIRRDEAGKPLYFMTALVDITGRKQAEEKISQLNAELEQRVEERTRELREAQEKLVRQEKLTVLGQLAGGVGHELRNPLGVINSAIYYLKLVQPEADDKVRQYHAMIEQEVHNAEKIITDLLDFARSKSADRESVSVPELVQRVLSRFPVPKSVEVALKLPAELPMIFADLRQMEQVLGNLTVNAWQAMGDGGKLTISAHRQKEMVVIAVNDTGVGITPEDMQKLFEPLFTTKPKGIGLGLAVSKKLVEANGGRIEVSSEPGKGSTFTVYLPTKDA